MTGARDFDFIHGSWRVSHQRLAQRLKGSAEWVRFGGTMRAKSILGGLGNFDENVVELPQGAYEACTVRMFDAQQSRWSIYWIDGRDPKLDPPMVGSFKDGVGTFFGDDVFEGRPIRIRFLWSQITERSARWEQAFSADAGATWETNWIMEFSRVSGPVIELRQYKIFPGKREQMIEVFDGKLIEAQEDVGMRLLGQFRDLDDPNRFTWMREFRNMEERQRALKEFYTGPVWMAHRGEANPLLEDNDNVLLLRPAGADLALKSLPASARSKVGAQPASAGVIVATIYYLWKDPAEGFTEFFQSRLAPELTTAGLPVLGAYVAETTPNNFPRLPVRQHEKVFVWFTRATDVPAHEKAKATLNARLSGGTLGAELADYQERPAQVLRLSPTSRSLLR
jgi:hypothetical protein